MKFLDFFAGIGGFRTGMEKAGHECVGFCEFDKYAVASYTSMHILTDSQRDYLKTLPKNQRQKEILKDEYKNGEWYATDIRRVRADELPRSDCWCFGAPCQSFSISGGREGLEGKSGLIQEIFRLLRETDGKYRPEWLIYENVKGMLSSTRGFDFLRILTELDEVGYDAEWENLDSRNFGLPQHRERVYVVGHNRRYGRREVLPLRECGEEVPENKGHKDISANTLTNPNRLTRGIYPIVGMKAATDRQTDRQTDTTNQGGCWRS